ncbi:MAG: hypothetical protein ACI4B3_10975, partial [Prevotella sp.]
MKKTLTIVFLLMQCLWIEGTVFKYRGVEKNTGERCLLVDEKGKGDFTFKTVQEALRYAERKSGEDVIEIYIKPSVYWIDDPDDMAIRRPEKGENAPYAMKLKVDNLKLIGLCDNAEDVVFACNRGQTQGADGNFTMFHFKGNNISAENITFGNYCNVDLIYKKDTTKNRKKRKDAIVQAQIAICEGENYHLKNCNFISR